MLCHLMAQPIPLEFHMPSFAAGWQDPASLLCRPRNRVKRLFNDSASWVELDILVLIAQISQSLFCLMLARTQCGQLIVQTGWTT